MQGFNRYFPPDFDPKTHGTLNSYHGKHALGDRARKLDQGILIGRFELPFNIWCGGCHAHIGQGVRYNAEKRKVGNYYSTPIYAFRCKCHLCSHWFEIRTDPQNTRYVVHEGARQKHEEWDAAEAGQYVIEQKDPDAPADGFATIEKANTDRSNALSAAARLSHLHALQDDRWSDPYQLSKKLRGTFRVDKKERQVREARDADLVSRVGLSSDIQLQEESQADKDEAHALWLKGKEGRSRETAEDRRAAQRLQLEAAPLASASRVPARKVKSSVSAKSNPGTSAKDLLACKLLGTSRRSKDPFLGAGVGSSSKLGKGVVKRSSLV